MRIRAGRWLGFGCLLSVAIGAAVPSRAWAQEEKPLAGYIPAEGLAAYVEYDGLDAHREAWRATALYKVLNETTTGAMLEQIGGQLLAELTEAIGDREDGPTVSEAVAMLRHVGRHGLALGVYVDREGDEGRERPSVVVVLRGAAEGKSGEVFLGYLERMADRGDVEEVNPPGDRTAYVVDGRWGYMEEGDDLVVAAGNIDAVGRALIAAIDGEAKSALDHPIVKSLWEGKEGVEPITIAFVDVEALPPMPQELKELGLDGVKRLESVGGIEGEALVRMVRVVAPAPRRGLLTLLDQPTFGAGSMPPLPEGVRDFTVVSVDWGKVLDAIATVPDAKRGIEEGEDRFQQMSGLDLRKDVLDNFGPRWAFYMLPQTVNAPGSPLGGMANWLLHPPKVAAVVEVQNRKAFVRNVDSLMDFANKMIRRESPRDLPPARFEKLEEGTGYVADVPPAVLPLPAGVRPALVIGDNYAALAISPEVARQALEAKSGGHGELAAFGDSLILLNQSDPRGSVPELIANVPFFLGLLGMAARDEGAPAPIKAFARLKVDPKLVPDPESIRKLLFPNIVAVSTDEEGLTLQIKASVPGAFSPATSGVAIALLLPAVQSAREAARRAQCTNNLKQIGLAMHNYHSALDRFPPAAIRDSNGKPLLSWRVTVLPYIGQQGLYEQFHLDEPWDSPHNLKLAETTPAVYVCPSGTLPPGQTPYRVITGEGAMFGDEKGARLAEITDGTSNSLMVVEGRDGVPWTKPEDFEYAGEGPLPAFGSRHAGGYNALFGDGSVRFIKDSIDEAMLRALMTIRGGEVIGVGAP